MVSGELMKRRLPHLSFSLPVLLVLAMLTPGGSADLQFAAAALYVGLLVLAMRRALPLAGVGLLTLLLVGAAWAADGYGYPEGYPVTGPGAGAGVGAVQAGNMPLPSWGDPLSYLLTLGPYGALLYGAVLMGRAIEKISTMQITVQVRLTDEDRAAVREMGASIRNLAERSERGAG